MIISTFFSGQDIRHMRLRAKLSVQKLADKIGVSKKTLQNWENDEGSPRFAQFMLMTYYCRVDAGLYVSALSKRKHPHQQIDLSQVRAQQEQDEQ